MKFDTWLDTFISEKGIDLDEVVEVTGPSGQINSIPLECVIEAIKGTKGKAQAVIKDALVKIDFTNGDIVGYLRHLAKALAV